MSRRRLITGQNLNGAISARVWNELVGLLEHRDRYGLWGGTVPSENAAYFNAMTREFWMLNRTGSNRALGDVMQVSGVTIDPDDGYNEQEREIVLESRASSEAINRPWKRFAVCLEPIEKDRLGRVALDGVCLANVEITNNYQTHAYYWWEGASERFFKLHGGYGGDCEIIAKPSGVGTKRCVVRLNAQPIIRVVTLLEDIDADSSGDCTMIVDEQGAITVTQEVWAEYCTGSVATFATGTQGLAYFFTDKTRWELIAAECQA